MNKLKKVLALVLAVATTMGLAGCTTYDNFKNTFIDPQQITEDYIYFGIYEPLTGKDREFGKDEALGIELAHEQRPEVLGKKIELINADNKSSIYEAESALDELFTHDVTFMFGSYGETLTLSAGDYLKANDCPAITITSTNPLITTNNPYYFTAAYSTARQGTVLANFITQGVLRENIDVVKLSGDDSAAEILRRFKSRLKKNTDSKIGVKNTYTVDPIEFDFSSVIERIQEDEADCVFLPVSSAAAMAFFKKAREMGCTDPLFIGINSWNDDELINYINSTGEFSIAYPQAAALIANDTEAHQNFVDIYHEKYGEDAEPSLTCATAYDSYMMAVQAIEDAYNDVLSWDIDEVVKDMTDANQKATRQAYDQMMESRIPDGVRIREALKNMKDYEGASGTISYKGNNECTKTIMIQYYINGTDCGATTW